MSSENDIHCLYRKFHNPKIDTTNLLTIHNKYDILVSPTVPECYRTEERAGVAQW